MYRSGTKSIQVPRTHCPIARRFSMTPIKNPSQLTKKNGCPTFIFMFCPVLSRGITVRKNHPRSRKVEQSLFSDLPHIEPRWLSAKSIPRHVLPNFRFGLYASNDSCLAWRRAPSGHLSGCSTICSTSFSHVCFCTCQCLLECYCHHSDIMIIKTRNVSWHRLFLHIFFLLFLAGRLADHCESSDTTECHGYKL